MGLCSRRGEPVGKHGNPIADGYTIIEKDDVRVGIIGMVTPCISRWDKANLEGCKVSDPVEETRKIIDQIKEDVDVLISVMHMGLDNEYGMANTGVNDLAGACPEFDLIVAAHQHKPVEGEEINGVLVVENKYHAAAALSNAKANVEPGTIRRCDVSRIYKYQNTLYTLEMTGAQLKKYLVWSVSYYKTFRKGDLSLSFDLDIPLYCYDMFQGVRYVIDVSKEPGKRIRDLNWPDGTSVLDDESFVIVVSSYRATTNLLIPDTVFEKDDMPRLLEMDVCGYLGGIREMIADYIQNVKGGKITPECNGNWRIAGIEWDAGLHQRAVELVANGVLELETDDKHLPSNVITEDDVRRVESEGGA